jgi:chromosome segregation ATPase
MTSVELRKKLKELNEGILRTETDLNNLSQQQKDCNRKLSQISARIGIANKKLQDKKNTYFRTQIELDTRISEEKTKQRQVEIDKKKKVLPTFEQWLKKEFKDLITETTELGIP